MPIDPVKVIRAVSAEERDDDRLLTRRSLFLAFLERVRQRLGLDRLTKAEEVDLALHVALALVSPKPSHGEDEAAAAQAMTQLARRIRRHLRSSLTACRRRLASARAERESLVQALDRALSGQVLVPAKNSGTRSPGQLERDLKKVDEGIAWTRERLENPLALVPEIVLAFLNGWKRRRGFDPKAPGWAGTPTRAHWVLVSFLQGVVLDMMAWFKKHTNYRFAPDQPFEFIIACEILNRLIHGTCRCAERLGRNNAFAYEARLGKHLGQHLLAAWRPEEVTLWSFLGRALSGALGKRIQRNLIDGGMFWDRLVEMLDLRTETPSIQLEVSPLVLRTDAPMVQLGRAALWVCPHCKKPTVASRCYRKASPECEHAPPFDARRADRVVKRFWIVDRRLYVQRPAVTCWNCGNFYPIDAHDGCPRCGSPRLPPAPRSGKIDHRRYKVHLRVWFPIPGIENHEITIHDHTR